MLRHIPCMPRCKNKDARTERMRQDQKGHIGWNTLEIVRQTRIAPFGAEITEGKRSLVADIAPINAACRRSSRETNAQPDSIFREALVKESTTDSIADACFNMCKPSEEQ